MGVMMIKSPLKVFSKKLIESRYRRWLNRFVITLPATPTVITISLVITGLIIGIRQTGSLQFLELFAFDQMVRLQPDRGADPRLLIVKITEADIKNQKQWPLTDQTLAQLLEKLQQHQPKAIGLDLYRNLPQPPGQTALLKQLQASNVITITNLGDTQTDGVPSIPGVGEDQIGFNDFVIDPDGIVRRNWIYAYQGTEKFYSFSLRLSLQYLKDRGASFQVKPDELQLGNTVFPSLQPNSGGYQDIDSTGYQVLLAYRSAEQVADQVSLTEVLQNQVEPNRIKNKVVLIGTTAPSLKDLFFTPYSAGKTSNPGMPGVMLHAQLVSQILSTVLNQQSLFWFWEDWAEGVWILGWAFVGGLIVWRSRHPLQIALTEVLGLAGLCGICFLIFTQAGWIPLVPAAFALLATSGCVLAYKILHNSLHDPLTGLPNRDLFLKQVEAAIALTKLNNQARFAVLFLDLDRFKIVNESLGHHIGDQLLIEVANRLGTSLKQRGILARVGGDEFAILLENISTIDEVIDVADRLQSAITDLFQIDQQEIFTSISIGIALSEAGLDYQPMRLLRDAHIAMYHAKDSGKAHHEVFALRMHNQVVKRFQLETSTLR